MIEAGIMTSAPIRLETYAMASLRSKRARGADETASITSWTIKGILRVSALLR